MRPIKITGLESLKLGRKCQLKDSDDSITPDMVTKNLQLKLNMGLKLNTPTMRKMSSQFTSPGRAAFNGDSLRFDKVVDSKNILKNRSTLAGTLHKRHDSNGDSEKQGALLNFSMPPRLSLHSPSPLTLQEQHSQSKVAPFRLPDINFQKKPDGQNEANESADQKRERKVFQSVCDTYQKIVYESENKVFASTVKLPARRQKLRVGFDKEKGCQIQMANSLEEKQLFGIMIVTTILNQSRFATQKLCRDFLQEAKALYSKAKDQKLEFYQFPEFIEHHLHRCQYDRDVEFNLFAAALPVENALMRKRHTICVRKRPAADLLPSPRRYSVDSRAAKQDQEPTAEQPSKNSGLSSFLRVIGVNPAATTTRNTNDIPRQGSSCKALGSYQYMQTARTRNVSPSAALFDLGHVRSSQSPKKQGASPNPHHQQYTVSEYDINSTITSAYDKMTAIKGKGLRQGERQKRIEKMHLNLKSMELSRIAQSKPSERPRRPTFHISHAK